MTDVIVKASQRIRVVVGEESVRVVLKNLSGSIDPSQVAFSATDKVLGRATAGAGAGEEITCTAAGRALLDDAAASNQRTTLGLGDSATKNVGSAAGTVCAGDDSRLSDARTPTAHTHGGGDVTSAVANATDADTVDGQHAAAFAAASHAHAGADITSGTIDGDRLPAMSETKLGGVPATGVPSGLYLRDDGTWAAAAGGSVDPQDGELVFAMTVYAGGW